MKPPRGMTLLELVMALAVVVVLSALAWPSFSGRLARERLNAVAQALQADLREARFEAARRGQPLHVALSAGPQWCWSVAATSGCDCALPQACQLQAARAKDYPGVQLLAAGSTRLNSDGGADTELVATFENKAQQQLRVSLSLLGRPRVCSPNSSRSGSAALLGHPPC